MPAIFTFRHYHYLVDNEAKAMAALKALSGAIRVEKHYDVKHGDLWAPDQDEHNQELSVSIVDARKLIARIPERDEEPEFIVTPPPRKPRGLLRQPRLLLKG
jgi:hypothetical protein